MMASTARTAVRAKRFTRPAMWSKCSGQTSWISSSRAVPCGWGCPCPLGAAMWHEVKILFFGGGEAPDVQVNLHAARGRARGESWWCEPFARWLPLAIPVDPAPALRALSTHLCLPRLARARRRALSLVVVTGGRSHKTQMASQRLVSSWDAISAKWAWVELNYRPHAYQA